MDTPRLTVGCPRCGAMVPHETILAAERIGWRHTCAGCGESVALDALRVAAALADDDGETATVEPPNPASVR
jgi:pyruvate/2-oxoacid:ferredoxin oxidoreductase beta subunit